MFAAMVLSLRTGLAGLRKEEGLKAYAWITFLTLFTGGMILGPVVQYYAFGAFWTGFPTGHDLTDNKTLIAIVFWIAALIAVHRSEKGRFFVIAASIVLIAVYLIPHSLLGSELDYEEYDGQISSLRSGRRYHEKVYRHRHRS
jgi:MFS family permease